MLSDSRPTRLALSDENDISPPRPGRRPTPPAVSPGSSGRGSPSLPSSAPPGTRRSPSPRAAQLAGAGLPKRGSNEQLGAGSEEGNSKTKRRIRALRRKQTLDQSRSVNGASNSPTSFHKSPSFMEMDDAASRSRPGSPSGRSDVSESDHPSESDENLWDDTDSEKHDSFLDVFPEPAKAGGPRVQRLESRSELVFVRRDCSITQRRSRPCCH